MKKLRIFVSSVQKELEPERLIILSLVSTDPFLQKHCEAILYELEPASPEKALEGCLKTLDTCHICLSIIWKEYGHKLGALSIAHHEYRRAKAKGIPILIYLKGPDNLQREPGTQKFVEEIAEDGLKRKRFGNILDLQHEVRKSLRKWLKESYGIEPSSDEDEIAQQNIEATSDFESQALKRIRWDLMDHKVARELIARAERKAQDDLTKREIFEGLLVRGLIWSDPDSGTHYATAPGIVLLAKNPSAVLPQCRILVDAYRGVDPDGDPSDHQDVLGPMPLAIEEVIAFIEKNTRHPMRIVGLSRVRLDEYPVEALREALVNAVAHRDYKDAGRKIMVEVFSNRVVISSPGYPPSPLTLPKLRSGKYKPVSRNPILAQSLSYFHRIEERGSGFRRMQDQMTDHGLDKPKLATETGYFQVIFPGPGDDIKRLRTPSSVTNRHITPSMEEKLTERQKKMIIMLNKGQDLTSRKCMKLFDITRDTASRDFDALVKLGIAQKIGAGRSTRYILQVKR